jgi:membrane protein YqaA with SNARE-associated domain
MEEWVINYGALGLFFVSFLAATIIPFSSEGALGAAVMYGLGTEKALLYASLGNVLGIVLNYYIGYLIADSRITRKWSDFQIKVHSFTQRYGVPALLFSWLPFAGDPITIAAGYGKMKFSIFIFIAGSLRVARYLAVVYFLVKSGAIQG